MSKYDFMRLLLFFDLPVKTKAERKIYTRFRKNLIKRGYLMIQYSVYVKLFNNRDAVQDHIEQLKKTLPQKGEIRIMMVTELQYARIEIILGGVSNIEKTLTINPFVHV